MTELDGCRFMGIKLTSIWIQSEKDQGNIRQDKEK